MGKHCPLTLFLGGKRQGRGLLGHLFVHDILLCYGAIVRIRLSTLFAEKIIAILLNTGYTLFKSQFLGKWINKKPRVINAGLLRTREGYAQP
jgi:hypothetical protein